MANEKMNHEEEKKVTPEEETSEVCVEEVEPEIVEEAEEQEETKEEQAGEDTRIADLTQQLTRLQADFANYKKRAEKERQAQAVFGIKQVAGRILPVIDNLERALATEKDHDPFYEGVALVYRQLLDALAEEKITPMDDLHKPFDPYRHHAVLTETVEGLEPDRVAEVLLQGYTYDHEDVIRPAMVKVSQS